MFKKHYKVKLRGCSAVEYIEDGKRIVVGAEMLSGEVDMVLYSSSLLSWESPFQDEKLTDEDKCRIMRNVTSDLKKHNVSIEWSE